MTGVTSQLQNAIHGIHVEKMGRNQKPRDRRDEIPEFSHTVIRANSLNFFCLVACELEDTERPVQDTPKKIPLLNSLVCWSTIES